MPATRKRRRKPTPTNSYYNLRWLLLATLGLLASAIYFWLSHAPHDGSESHKGPAFKVADLPGRGKGIIATRDIEQGELLIREEPLFVLPVETTSPQKIILQALENLNSTQRQAFLNLSYVGGPSSPDEGDIALAIVETNAVAAGEGRAGVFPRMARLNHGCGHSFNVVYSWRDEQSILLVHALKPIKEGEELLTAYMDTKKTRDERRAFLAQHYHFHCECSACSLEGADLAKSDYRLSKMSEIFQELGTWSSGRIDGKVAIELVRTMLTLGEDEGYWSERGKIAADAVWVAAAHMDYNAAREWAAFAANWYACELGKDSKFVKQMETVTKDPRSHQSWGTRAEMKVGEPPLLPSDLRYSPKASHQSWWPYVAVP